HGQRSTQHWENQAHCGEVKPRAAAAVIAPLRERACADLWKCAAGALRELRRCAPHGSLPPCGGGTGRGVATRHKAEGLDPCTDPRTAACYMCWTSDVKQTQCSLYPSPCPSPTRGEGTLWHRSAQPQTSIRVDVCMP